MDFKANGKATNWLVFIADRDGTLPLDARKFSDEAQ